MVIFRSRGHRLWSVYSFIAIHFEGLGKFRIQNQPIVAGSMEVSIEVSNGGDMHETGVLTESGDLVILIVNVALCKYLKVVELSDDGGVVEPMV